VRVEAVARNDDGRRLRRRLKRLRLGHAAVLAAAYVRPPDVGPDYR
jgi:hypothetical protein